MRKYLTIMKIELQKQFAHRYEIASFLPGHFFEVFFAYFLWTIIFQTADIVQGYTYNEMITYVIIGWVFYTLTAAYNFEYNISSDIRLGLLTNYLVKPVSYLKFTLFRATGRVIIAVGFIALLSSLFLFLFGDKLVVSVSFTKVAILLLMLAFSFLTKLLFAILFGLFSFWFMEISGLFAFVNMIIDFFAGAFFPLVMLPVIIYKIGLFLPFMYLFYIPVQFFLDKVSINTALLGLGVQLVWIILLYLTIKIVWKFGLKKYEGYGI